MKDTARSTWQGFGGSLAVAFMVCAAFVGGVKGGLLEQPKDPLAARKDLLYRDFGQIGQFRSANLALSRDPRRVIFMGDSITRIWNLQASFPGEPFLNRGIDSQTTSQMLVRFRQDVLDLQPASVVILGGTNDLGDTTTAPVPIPDIERNLRTMAELAAAHGIRPIIASVLPVHSYGSKLAISAMRTPESILAVNAWARAYCAQYRYTYIDYHSALVSADGMMRKELSDDGVHPNAAGYQIMSSVASSAIR